MVKSRLITASLISSVEWLKICPESYKEDALKSLKNQLNRVWDEPSVAAKAGIEFENAVQKFVTMKKFDVGTELFQQVLKACEGGEFQRKSRGNLKIEGDEANYFLYGKIDVYFPSLLLDLKTTGVYKVNKYLKTVQHLIYCLNEQIKEFKYLVVEWEKPPKIKAIHEENFKVKDFDEVYNILVSKIKTTIAYLQLRPELWKAYTEKYCLY